MKKISHTNNSGHTALLSNNQGIVYRRTTGNYVVHTNGRTVSCVLSSRLRKNLDGPRADDRRGQDDRRGSKRQVMTNDDTDPIAVGDQVEYVDASDGTGMIVNILPRRNYLSRQTPVPMPSARPFEQVIAANVDQVVPVFAAANPEPKWNMLDRYLVSAEAAEIPALVVITKADLVTTASGSLDGEVQEAVDGYRQIGYPVLLVSAVTGAGLKELREALSGRISVFLGKSGVGKSSLLNALQPGLGLRVNEVSQVTGKGRHTTTHLEMFPLEFGGAIVDTPGVREFGLWDVDPEEMAYFFPEMRPYLGRCKFGMDCRHDEEPGCALRKAVTAGQISPRRYQSYMRLKYDG